MKNDFNNNNLVIKAEQNEEFERSVWIYGKLIDIGDIGEINFDCRISGIPNGLEKYMRFITPFIFERWC